MLGVILNFTFPGRPLRGKSGQLVCRGRKYPDKAWAVQRDAWAVSAKQQAYLQYTYKKADGVDIQKLPLSCPIKLSGVVRYPDKREADLDGVIGAIGHVLERAGIITNDKQIHAVDFTTGLANKDRPRCLVRLETNYVRSA